MTSPTTDRRQGLNSSVALKVPCRAATTAPIVLSGLQTVDNVVLAAGDRVLVKNQASSVYNGIYVADTGNWTRDLDADGYAEFLPGTFVIIREGTVNSFTAWMAYGMAPIIPGTTAITFVAIVPPSVFASDSALLGFLQSGVGTLMRSLQDEGRDYLRATQFMTAAQLGHWRDQAYTADFTAVLRTAYTEAVASGRGLLLPPGGGVVTGTPFTLTNAQKCFQKIRGMSMRTRLHNLAGANTPTILFQGAQWWEISGLVLTGAAGYPNEAMKTIADGAANRVGFGRMRDIQCNPNGMALHLQDANTIWIDGMSYWSGNFGGTIDYFDPGPNTRPKYLTHAIQADGVSSVNSIDMRGLNFNSINTIADGGSVIRWNCVDTCNDVNITESELENIGRTTHRVLDIINVFGFSMQKTYVDNCNLLFRSSRDITLSLSAASTMDIQFGTGAADSCAYAKLENFACYTLTADANNSHIDCKNIRTQAAWAMNAVKSVLTGCSDAVVGDIRDTHGTQLAIAVPPYAGGNYTGSGAMTWTVEAADVNTFFYTVIDGQLTINFMIFTTDVGGAPDKELRIKFPEAIACKYNIRTHITAIDNGGAAKAVAAAAAANGTYLSIYNGLDPATAGNWTASAGATAVWGQVVIPIK